MRAGSRAHGFGSSIGLEPVGARELQSQTHVRDFVSFHSPFYPSRSVRMENDRHHPTTRRQPLRLSSVPNWKLTLRDNCNKRVKEDRTRLLWSFRSPHSSTTPPEAIQSAFQQIMTDELEKMRRGSLSSSSTHAVSSPILDDDLWEYDGLHDAYQGECEEILLEMQSVFYQDLRPQPLDGAADDTESVTELWEDAEDEYLARATYEYMCLTNENDRGDFWCPVCKTGLLKQDHLRIYCSLCKLQLQRGDEANLELLRGRLAEAHADHSNRGCKSSPKFSLESQFGLTALYILCEDCHMFEIVM